ncbi:right-handed parallel beta-helix repeat-containing protein [Candidatus Bathyarchaeota archaeon]|nr:right-handed parallel beta-helix repeat-containing protein [Candidatus Bathyarchaeota archaeon]
MGRKLLLLMLLALLIGTLNLASRVEKAKASGTIYIRTDGRIDPPTTPIVTVDKITYTFTGNIYDSIVVERDNIVVDGDDHATQGIGTGTGIELSYRSNVTIENVVITQFDFGISLNHSANCAIVRNIMMENSFEAIRLYESSSNNITSNDINATEYDGIVLYGSSDNKIEENNLTDNYDGIRLYESSKNDITENIVASNYYGIFLALSSNNSIFHNNVTTNDGNGVSLAWSSSENRIEENHIEANKWCGIYLNASSSNLIYHNSFVDNAQQISVNDSPSLWDDGYPSGGNYWSNYTGVDVKCSSYQNETGSDGVGDTPYIIDANNTDHYPLMGMFQSYNVTYFTPPLVAHSCSVTVISNSTVSNFVTLIWIEHPEVIMIEFNVTEEQGTTGFCRVSFPTAMMNGTYHVLVNGTEVPYILLPCSNADYSHLYFTYTHSTKGVIIIPEFPSFIILPLFMITTLLAVIVYRKKHAKISGTP